MNEKTKSNRVVYLDLLRILAIGAVVILHVASLNWAKVDVNGHDWRVFNFYDSIVRWGVPVFVMISGTLFLNKENMTAKKIYSKYILRLLTAYITWSFIYYIFSGASFIQQIDSLMRTNLLDSIADIINGHYHLWFIPMMIGIYMCLPIIKQIVRDEKIARYFLLLSLVFWCLVPQTVELINDFAGEKMIVVIGALYEQISEMRLSLVMNFALYFILGYEISKVEFSKEMRTVIYILGVAGGIFTIVIDWLVTIKKQTPIQTYYNTSCVNVLFEALAVFELCKSIPFKKDKIYKIITKLSKWSFGAYLVHALVIECFVKSGFDMLSFLPIVTVPIMSILVLICSFVISAILNSVPILNKYIV